MKRYQLSVVTSSPLSVSTRIDGSSYQACLEWLPAAGVRGALAAHYLQTPGRSPSDELFRKLFSEGGARFEDLYPDALPPARSLVACGHLPGPPPHGHYQEDLIAFALAERLHRKLTPPPADCPVCGAAVTFVPDLLVSETGGRRTIARNLLVRKRQGRGSGEAVSIPAVTETLPAGLVFSGGLSIRADLCEAVVELLPPGAPFFLGGGRAVGLGRAEVLSLKEAAPREAASTRVALLRSYLATKLGEELPEDLWIFAVALESELLLLDSHLRTRGRLEAADLWSGSTPPPEWLSSLRVIAEFCETDVVRGYNAHPAVNMPRAPEPVLARGSVFVFATLDRRAPPEAQQRELFDAYVAGIEERPWGELTHLGLGRIGIYVPPAAVRAPAAAAAEHEPPSAEAPEEA